MTTNYPCKNRDLGCKYVIWEKGDTCLHCKEMGTPGTVYRNAVDEIANLYGSYGTNSNAVYAILKRYFNEKRQS